MSTRSWWISTGSTAFWRSFRIQAIPGELWKRVVRPVACTHRFLKNQNPNIYTEPFAAETTDSSSMLLLLIDFIIRRERACSPCNYNFDLKRKHCNPRWMPATNVTPTVSSKIIEFFLEEFRAVHALVELYHPKWFGRTHIFPQNKYQRFILIFFFLEK